MSDATDETSDEVADDTVDPTADDTADDTAEATADDSAPVATPDLVPDETPASAAPDSSLESDHAVDHGPLDRAEDAIDEAKAAAGRLDQLGGTGGGDVTGDISTPGAGDDRETGQESAPEGTSDSH